MCFIINHINMKSNQKLIFKKNDDVEIGYDQEINATYMQFKCQVNEDDFIEYHLDLLDALNTKKFTSGKHLVDSSKLKLITNSSRKWLGQNVMPKIQENSSVGEAHIAVVLGCNSFSDYGAEHIESPFGNSINIHFFSQMEDAKMWLTPEFAFSY